MESAQIRLAADIAARTVEPRARRQRTDRPEYEFDVAISFAGTERPLAEALANVVRDAGFRVFYDDFYPDALWAKIYRSSLTTSTVTDHGIAWSSFPLNTTSACGRTTSDKAQ